MGYSWRDGHVDLKEITSDVVLVFCAIKFQLWHEKSAASVVFHVFLLPGRLNWALMALSRLVSLSDLPTQPSNDF